MFLSIVSNPEYFNVMFRVIGFLAIVYGPVIMGVVQAVIYFRKDPAKPMARLWVIAEIACLVGYPVVYFLIADHNWNDCCNPVDLSPPHRLSVMVLVALATISAFAALHKTKILSPVIEVLLNCFLLTGIVITVLIAIQNYPDPDLGFLGLPFSVVVVVYLLMALHRNNALYTKSLDAINSGYKNGILRAAHKLLSAHVLIKYPLLLMFCLPLLVMVAVVLLLFGQRPDSIIQAFTDTYHRPLSLHDCTNVECPSRGHYLCTIAANGHPVIVKPCRTGFRHGEMIKVNRQLLVANAFEELLQEHFPTLHKPIRHNYDKVGNWLYATQRLLNNKWISDAVYYLMKPLECFFLLTLYMFDRKPENRIARQYISEEHRILLRNS